MTKTKVEDAKIVESLENLRRELLEKTDFPGIGAEYREILYKINSCLFSEYPHK